MALDPSPLDILLVLSEAPQRGPDLHTIVWRQTRPAVCPHPNVSIINVPWLLPQRLPQRMTGWLRANGPNQKPAQPHPPQRALHRRQSHVVAEHRRPSAPGYFRAGRRGPSDAKHYASGRLVRPLATSDRPRRSRLSNSSELCRPGLAAGESLAVAMAFAQGVECIRLSTARWGQERVTISRCFGERRACDSSNSRWGGGTGAVWEVAQRRTLAPGSRATGTRGPAGGVNQGAVGKNSRQGCRAAQHPVPVPRAQSQM